MSELIDRQEFITRYREWGYSEYGHMISDDALAIRVAKSLSPVDPQELSRDMEEIREVMSCDADAEAKCRMISDILTAPPHYFKMPEGRK